MKSKDHIISSQIQKAHSIGSIATMITFIINAFASRIKGLEFLTFPLIIVVCLTIFGTAFFFSLSIKHKEKIENPVKNNVAFIFRIVINLVLLLLMVV
ncbi:hypothetical protein [Algoriphagus sp. NG3]|uniref:hypothetical protein n=1 Tax=unclassified Algoriphagus TaxID=2641541 RepID=UPI002A81E0CF|nr:hypothetical protein [Algoriphagus sp. NG3]WPR74330.1 hypothetical protein SLW71_16820 [Algoriphagus sp. NG3]